MYTGFSFFDVVEDIQSSVVRETLKGNRIRRQAAAGRRAENRVVALAPFFSRYCHDSNRRRGALPLPVHGRVSL